MTQRIMTIVAAAGGLLLTANGCHVSGSASASAGASSSTQSSGGSDAVVVETTPAEQNDYQRRDTDGQTRPPRETTPIEPNVIAIVTNPEASEVDDDAPVFGSTDDLDASFTGNVYYLPENTRTIPDLGALEPVGTVHTRRIDIAPRRFDEGFPGIGERFEWFAIRYTARVHFPSDGVYGFRMNSDDGSVLKIDGQEVVNNDGQHAPRERSGSVELTAGPHDIQLDYYQGPRYQIALQLWWTAPGGEEMILELAPANP